MPVGDPIDDVAAATAKALRDPHDFPSIVQSVVPSDSVAIAIDRNLPQVGQVAKAIVKMLIAAEIAPEQMTLVLANSLDASTIEHQLPAETWARIKVSTHDPMDKNMLSYLAASAAGDPIYVNRFICDADFVIPVGRVSMELSTGARSASGGVFPSFADLGTQRRLASQTAVPPASGPSREVDEAAWLLGARFTVQLVPAGGEDLLHVVAGDIDSVRSRTATLAAEAWNVVVPESAELVVAAVSGTIYQSWEHVVRSIVAASRVAKESDAAIVVCCDLADPPGPAIQLIVGSVNLDEAESRIAEGEFVDAGIAHELIRVLRNTRLYLLSQLPENVVTDLGVAYVSESHEVKNLCQRHATYAVLRHAQLCWPTREDSVNVG